MTKRRKRRKRSKRRGLRPSREYPFCPASDQNEIRLMTWQRLNCKESFAKGAKKDMLPWHWINCLLLGLSLVEKFVCYCVKCYLCAYPSVRLSDCQTVFPLSLSLSLFLSLVVSVLATRCIVYHFRSRNSHVMFGVHFVCLSL